MTITNSQLRGSLQFEPEGSDHHSSSIVDLIESCKSAVAFVQNLEWPDEVANALFLTKLSQVPLLLAFCFVDSDHGLLDRRQSYRGVLSEN